MPDRTRIAERYARGVVAAVAAVAALVLAGNAGPAQSAERHPGDVTGRAGDAGASLTSAVRLDGGTWAPRPGPR
ncbi:hypothetical protein ACGF7W_10085 [Streptomyces sp. NPDC048219]|uniref:hypothetical protein n=1 Tax=Streptomyces sp. NPDC048219 TaxID=3365517 RepID=UPI00371DF00B